jgi:ribosomal protein S18 acetylase RimI-like enzyme
MQIRPLLAADATAYQSLRLRALQECPTAFASSHDEEADDTLDSIGARLAPSTDSASFGALRDGALVGIATVTREAARKLAHKALLWGVYVAPEHRRHGTARQLVERAVAHALSMPGVRQVNLSVNAANAPAIALYQAAGFKSFGIERGYLQVDGVLHDEMHMALYRKAGDSAADARSLSTSGA